MYLNLVRQYAVTVTKSIGAMINTKNLDESQRKTYGIYLKNDTFIIDFRNLLKASRNEYDQIETDKTASERSYLKKIKQKPGKKQKTTILKA